MKKIIMFLLLTNIIYSYETIKTIYSINNNLLVDIIEDGDKKGFLIRNKIIQIYLITHKSNYYRTFRNKNHNWDVFIDCYNGEILGISEYDSLIITNDNRMKALDNIIRIPVETIHYADTNIIDFIFSLPIGDLRYLRLNFFKEDLL